MQPRAAPWVWKTVAIESNSVRVRKEKASPTPSAFAHLNNVIQPRASPWAVFANAFGVENSSFDTSSTRPGSGVPWREDQTPKVLAKT